MDKHLVLTLSGPDRVGMVEKITELVFKQKGSVGESRMARLEGEFAVLMLITVDQNNYKALEQSLTLLQNDGYKVTLGHTETAVAQKYADRLPYKIIVNGADHEGIVHKIAQLLADKNINIESMETHIRQAPMSGAPLFIMKGIILAPGGKSNWKEDLLTTAEEMNVDIEISAYTG